MNKNVEIKNDAVKEARIINAAIPEDIAEVFIADLEDSLKELDLNYANRRRSLQSAITGLKNAKNHTSPTVIIPAKRQYKKKAPVKHVTHVAHPGKLGNDNRKGKKNHKEMRTGLLSKILNVVKSSNIPPTSGQVRDILVKEYGYKNKKEIDSLESSIAAILYQYTTGNGGMKQIFERTEGDNGAYIYSIRKEA